MKKVGPHLTQRGGLFFVLEDQSVVSCKCVAGPYARRVALACVHHERRFEAALKQIVELEGDRNDSYVATAALRIAKDALAQTIGSE